MLYPCRRKLEKNRLGQRSNAMTVERLTVFFCIFTVVKKFQHVPAKKFPDVSFLFQFDQFTYYAAPCLDHKCWELIDLWLSVIITILHKIRQYKVDL